MKLPTCFEEPHRPTTLYFDRRYHQLCVIVVRCGVVWRDAVRCVAWCGIVGSVSCSLCECGCDYICVCVRLCISYMCVQTIHCVRKHFCVRKHLLAANIKVYICLPGRNNCTMLVISLIHLHFVSSLLYNNNVTALPNDIFQNATALQEM